MKKLTIKVYQKPVKNRQDSFWYEGDIALFKYKNREVLLIANGDIRIHDKDGLVHNGCKERGNGIKGGLNCDKDLKKIGQSYSDEYHWENNNWFECLFRFKGDLSFTDTFGDVDYYYKDAIKHAKEMIKDDEYWKEVKA